MTDVWRDNSVFTRKQSFPSMGRHSFSFSLFLWLHALIPPFHSLRVHNCRFYMKKGGPRSPRSWSIQRKIPPTPPHKREIRSFYQPARWEIWNCHFTMFRQRRICMASEWISIFHWLHKGGEGKWAWSYNDVHYGKPFYLILQLLY